MRAVETLSAGPGVSPGERDADDDDVGQREGDEAASVVGSERDEESAVHHEPRSATTSAAPDALDEDDADE